MREIYCGRLEGVPLVEVQRRYPFLWQANLRQADDDFHWPGGESYRDFRRRALRAVGAIAAAHPGELVMIVTHAGVIAQVLGALNGIRAARWEPFRPSNARRAILPKDGGWDGDSFPELAIFPSRTRPIGEFILSASEHHNSATGAPVPERSTRWRRPTGRR